MLRVLLLYLVFTVSALSYPPMPEGEVTDIKIRAIFDDVIAHSYVQPNRHVHLYKVKDTGNEAHEYRGDVYLESNETWEETFDNFNQEDKNSRDTLVILLILAHEYGHVQQEQLGLMAGKSRLEIEVEATTFASYALLQMGYTKQQLRDFYLEEGDMSTDDASIGHGDVKEEFRRNAENVYKLEELLPDRS